jgi:arginine utilization protein RocB
MLRSVLSEYSLTIGKSLRVRPYFPGISDMSFLSPADSAEQRAFVMDKSALGNDEQGLPFQPLECPVLNVGPWGRDYHQAGERVHREYSFVELPELVWRLTAGTLDLDCPKPNKPAAYRIQKAEK